MSTATLQVTRSGLRHNLRRVIPSIRQPLYRPASLPLTFASHSSTSSRIPFTLQAIGTGVAQTISIPGSPHKIQTDAYSSFGGSDSAPSPLHYNLSALSSCTQVTGSVVAKDHGISLGKWEVDVTGQLDPAVLAGGAKDNGNGGNWNAVELAVRVQVKGQVSEAEWEKCVSEVERRCPVTQLFRKSGVEWSSKWTRL